MKGDEIFRAFERLGVEPVTLSKYVAEYEQMWKWIVKFLSKFQGRSIKIDRVSSIRVSKSTIFFNILSAVARLSDVIMSYRFLWVELASTSPWSIYFGHRMLY